MPTIIASRDARAASVGRHRGADFDPDVVRPVVSAAGSGVGRRMNRPGRYRAPPPAVLADRLGTGLKIINEIIQRDSIYCSFLHHPEEMQPGDMGTEFELYLPRVVDLIAELFTVYTGYDSAVCIKALNRTRELPNLVAAVGEAHDDAAPYVYTFWRDSASRPVREKLDGQPGPGIYRHDVNTGLTLARKRGYWFSNDLVALGTSYESGNPDWPRYYDATAIVNMAYPSEGKPIAPLGFLCVDNKGGGFNDDACRYILEILANILHYSVRMTMSVSIQEGKHE